MREIRFDYINWYTVCKDIARNILIIILAAVSGFLGVRAYFDFTYRPVYKSTTTISISATSSGLYTFSNLNKTISAASTFQEMFQSSYFREKLADMTGKPVDGTITAEQIESTNLITISYSCSSPVEAYTMLTAIVSNYNEITAHNFDNMIINTLSAPVVPTVPSNPISYGNYDKIAAAALAALVLVITVIASYFRDTVKNESDVNAMLDAKLFSVIYHEEKNKTLIARLRFTHSKEPLMITNILINYRFAETFRIAALKLEYLMNTKKIKTIMITSCGENEGKSTVSVNLALSMAKLGKKTLLIDADLRKPAVYKFFKDKSKNTGNLNDIINGKAQINDMIFKDDDTGLYILAGNERFSDSSELLSTGRFAKFVDALKEQFDIVIFDTAPVSLVSDAEIISTYIDAAFIVVAQDGVPVPQINDMIDSLTQSGTVVEGCIFNNVHTLPVIRHSDAEPIPVKDENSEVTD